MTILEEDYENILGNSIDWEMFRGATVLVTGAGGMIGSYLVKLLGYANRKYLLQIRVLAAVHRREQEELFAECPGCKVISGDIRQPLPLEEKVDYIFHCASVTHSEQMVSKPVETADIILKGTEQMLKLAREHKVKGMVFLSTMEVYGQTADNREWSEEQDLGYIDLFRGRSCYPLAKRMAEHMCFANCQEYGISVKTARLSQTFGPGILPGESRIFAQVAHCVINRKDIILHTSGESYGNYCYLADCIRGILILLAKGKDGEVYNVTNEECCCTILDMAGMAARDIAEGKIKVVVSLSADKQGKYPEATKLKLSSRKLRDLGWKPSVGLQEMYKRMIIYMMGQP